MLDVDTPLERTKAQLLAARHPNGTAGPSNPKLQKRGASQRISSNDWPLLSPPLAEERIVELDSDSRPSTADGVGVEPEKAVEPEQPDIKSRRVTMPSVKVSGGLGAAAAASGEREAGDGGKDEDGIGKKGVKKKKFQFLRRAFRIQD
jgi:hypothetical protein